MQCGRLPKRPLAIATGPTRASMPAVSAPRRKISAVAARPGAASAGSECGSPHGQSWPATGSSASIALVVRLEVGVVDRPVGADAVRGCRCGSPTGGTAACSRRSAPSSRRRRGRSCCCPAAPGRSPPIWRGSVQYSPCEPRSSLTQSRSGSQNGPASRQTTRQPARASRWVSTPPPAPAPTTTRSTSSSRSKRRMSVAQPVVGAAAVVGQQPGRLVAGADAASALIGRPVSTARVLLAGALDRAGADRRPGRRRRRR